MMSCNKQSDLVPVSLSVPSHFSSLTSLAPELGFHVRPRSTRPSVLNSELIISVAVIFTGQNNRWCIPVDISSNASFLHILLPFFFTASVSLHSFLPRPLNSRINAQISNH